MNATVMSSDLRTATADRCLNLSVRFCFLAIATGEVLFTLALASLYGPAALHQDPHALTRFMAHGYIAGDLFGNTIVGLHIVSAVIMNLGGIIQLIPQVRQRFPRLHWWLGRTYLLSAAGLSLAGLYITWLRATGAPIVDHFGISVDAVLILLCGFLTLHYALKRQADRHRRWALRLFLVGNGSFFFRTGVFFWLAVNHGPVGFDPDTFEGPFLTFMSIAESVLPLALLQLYFWAQKSSWQAPRYLVAAGLSLAALEVGIGVLVLSTAIWVPLIMQKPLAF
jgi:uncharacterized membrane protein